MEEIIFDCDITGIPNWYLFRNIEIKEKKLHIKFISKLCKRDLITKMLCDIIAEKENIISLSLSCRLNNSYANKLLAVINAHRSITNLYIRLWDYTFTVKKIYNNLNNVIEKCHIIIEENGYNSYVPQENDDVYMLHIEKKCRFNKINNRVPIYMMMLRKRADCVVHLLPRRVLMYLLGFINSRWI